MIDAMRLPARRIHLADTDATGVAYAGRLVDLCLQRLEEAMASAGIEAADHAAGPAGPAVARIEADFLRPARLGDAVAAAVSCTTVGTSSAHFAVALDGRVAAVVVLVWVDRAAGRSAPWPPALRRRLLRFRPAPRRRPRARRS
jgi:acyl-CoA thioesterase FadM